MSGERLPRDAAGLLHDLSNVVASAMRLAESEAGPANTLNSTLRLTVLKC